MPEPQGEPISPLFDAWAGLVLRLRVPLLVLTLAVTAGMGYLAKTRARIDTNIEVFTRGSANNTLAVLDELRAEFGRDDLFIVLVEGDVFSLDYLERLRGLHEAIEALDVKLEGVEAATAPPPEEVDGFGDDEGWGDEEAGSVAIDEVTSLINARRTRSNAAGDGIEVGEWMDPFPTAEALPELREALLADPKLVGMFVGAEARHSALVVQTVPMSDSDSEAVEVALQGLLRAHAREGFGLALSGTPALVAGLKRLMATDMQRMVLISVALMIVMLAWLFRHPVGVVTPLLVVMMSAVTTVGAMALLGWPLTMISNILPAFLFVVGVGDSVHILSVFREHRREGLGARDAARRTIATTGTPVFYTSLTTMVGLASFRFASIEAIQHFGVAGALGVGVAMVHSLVFLPIVLSFTGEATLGARPLGERDLIDELLAGCLACSGAPKDPGIGALPAVARKRRNYTLTATVILAALAGLCATRLSVSHNPLAWVPEDKPIRQTFDAVDRHLGGNANVSFLIDANTPRGLRSRELMLGLERLEAHVANYKDPEFGALVGGSVSPLDVVRETHRALKGGGAAEYRVPETERGVSDMLFLFENAGPEELARLATNDLSRGQMSLRLRWLDATRYLPLTAHINEGIERFIPEPAVVRPTGAIYNLATTVSALLRDLVRSFGVALLIIALIMGFVLGSLRLGLVAMVPNVLPILLVMGGMGLSGVPIDMMTIMIASIAIGLAVDDTIHLMHHFRVRLGASGNAEVALRGALAHSGRAMVSTTVILTVGFSAYLGATMHSVQRFGVLIAASALMALLIDLIVTPALLRLVFKRPE